MASDDENELFDAMIREGVVVLFFESNRLAHIPPMADAGVHARFYVVHSFTAVTVDDVARVVLRDADGKAIARLSQQEYDTKLKDRVASMQSHRQLVAVLAKTY